ncbi:MAG TPA: acyltransferase [Kaistia sp.]|nr:acyltransferase [Kaistia sp.]
MKSIGSVLDANRGIGPGFNLLRLILALTVVFIHCSLIDNGAAADQFWPYGARWALNNVPVPMFFVVSGFLVAASVERLSLDQFLVNRLLRILPALVLVVALAALVLGPLMTQDSLGTYFSKPGFYAYFLNAAGLHHDALPGVFETNPAHEINGSLWTIPHEVSCYILLAVIAGVGLLRRRWLVLGGTIALYAVAIGFWLIDRYGLQFPLSDKLTYVFVWRGAAKLVPLFLTGTLFHLFRANIPMSRVLGLAASGALVAIAIVGNPSWQDNPIIWAVTAPLFAYVAVWLGLSAWFALPILAGLDYSYGIYLFGFPVQQTLIHFLPGISNYGVFFVISAVPTIILAALSWHFVEKPALGLKRRIGPAISRLVARTRRSPASA